MDASSRRDVLLNILKGKQSPVSGGKLALELGVSRQVIVQDVALLRAGGNEIFATPQGYILIDKIKTKKIQKVLACQHSPQGIEEELDIIISTGGKVLDVIVEHPLYGELKGLLMIETKADLSEFMAHYKEVKAEPLSALTKGVHLHTIEAEDEDTLQRVKDKLEKKGILLSEV